MARVLMFGRLADIAGWRERIVAADRLSALRSAIGERQPELARALDADAVSVIVNDVLTRGDTPVADADEVAFLPPMSGG